MNILYISHLSDNSANGMAWSVPASVAAQSRYDNVLWVNLTPADQPHWHHVAAYHNIGEYGGRLRFEALPQPFDKPDLVVQEGFYNTSAALFYRHCLRARVPYIVVPRGSLTRASLHNHAWLKKAIAHAVLFTPYVRHAAAIQYLTAAEHADSGDRWNDRCFVLPNGYNTPDETKQTFFASGGISAVFIGRIDKYAKGLDWLLDAVGDLQGELRAAGFTLAIYGPHRASYNELEQIIAAHGIGDIVSLPGEVQGEAKRQALLAADMFVLTSRFEGHPMGLIEALAYGVPALITRGTNMLPEVAECNAGWTCEGGREAVRDALRQALADRQHFADKGRAAAKLATRYDWDRIARQFHAEAERVLYAQAQTT